MDALALLSSLGRPGLPSLAVAGLEAVGIAAYAALVVVVLRLAMRWAESAVTAGSTDVAPNGGESQGDRADARPAGASGRPPNSPTPSARG